MILIFFHGILILRYLYFGISKIINKGSGSMKEKEWKVIPYAPYYKISNYGEVYKFKGEKSPRMMKAKKDKDGYLFS